MAVLLVSSTASLAIAASDGALRTGHDRSERGAAETGASAAVEQANATVTFENQSTTGDRVVVASVRLPEGGFVAIHDERLLAGDAFESILGFSRYLEPGRHADVTVPLEASLNGSQTLIASAYRDTNGNEQFDYRSSLGDADGPYTAGERTVEDQARVRVVDRTTTTTAVETPTTIETPTTAVETPTTAVETPTTTETTEPAETTTEIAETTTEIDETTTEVAETTPAPTAVASFGVSQLFVPERAPAGETLPVSAVVTNPNDQRATESVEVRLDGTVVERRSVSLDPDERTRVEFGVPTETLPAGQHTVSVFTRDFGQIAVLTLTEEPAETTPGTTTQVEPATETTPEPTGTPTETRTVEGVPLRVPPLDVPDSFVLEGRMLVVNSEVTNPTDRTVRSTVRLRVAGAVVEERPVEVGPGETVRVRFDVDLDSLGQVGDEIQSAVLAGDFSDLATFTVEAVERETATPTGTEG